MGYRERQSEARQEILSREGFREELSKTCRVSWSDVELRKFQSETHRGRYGKRATVGYVDCDGYFILCGQDSHPLAYTGGMLAEHRKVLYDRLGCESLDCEHECYWGCGKVLTWGGTYGICADHLDGDKLNNDPENLVPSCSGCNTKRRFEGNPVVWSSSV